MEKVSSFMKFILLLFGVFFVYDSFATNTPEYSKEITIDNNAAWCWFGDPRAIEDDHSLYITWISNAGDIMIHKKDFWDNKNYQKKLPIRLSRNDHNNPSLLYLRDGNIMIFYSQHNGDKMYYQKTQIAGDIETFSEPQYLKSNTGKGFTYPNPINVDFYGRERILLFWRGYDWQPRFTYSDDQGQTWAKSLALVKNTGQRPYVKYFKGKSGKIHIAMTDGHPRNNATNSIYYMYMKDSVFYKSNGERLGNMLNLPFNLNQLEKVYDPVKMARPAIRAGEKVFFKRSWIWSIAEDNQGKPVIAYSITDKNFKHSYMYAQYDQKWSNQFITFGGGTIQLPGRHKREHYYAGGVFIDPEDTNRVYISTNHNRAKHQIEEWYLRRKSRFKKFRTFQTQDSSFRPFVPYIAHNRVKRKSSVLWMAGTYNYYTDFQTKIVGVFKY